MLEPPAGRAGCRWLSLALRICDAVGLGGASQVVFIRVQVLLMLLGTGDAGEDHCSQGWWRTVDPQSPWTAAVFL